MAWRRGKESSHYLTLYNWKLEIFQAPTLFSYSGQNCMIISLFSIYVVVSSRFNWNIEYGGWFEIQSVSQFSGLSIVTWLSFCFQGITLPHPRLKSDLARSTPVEQYMRFHSKQPSRDSIRWPFHWIFISINMNLDIDNWEAWTGYRQGAC